MSWQDRPYSRREQTTRRSFFGGGGGRPPRGGGGPPSGGGGGFGSGFDWGSMTGRLIIINVVVFLAALMTSPQGHVMKSAVTYWGNFNFADAITHVQLWRFLTFQFLHANFGHILFNMIALFFFGPMIEQYLGSKRYLAFYLISGVAGAVMYLLLYGTGVLISSPAVPMVGASAGIFGVLVGAAIIAPDARVMLLIPPIPMKLRTMALIFLGIALFTVISQGNNAGGEAAHLGGALAGYLLIRRADLLNFADFARPMRSGHSKTGASSEKMSNRKSFAKRVSDYKDQREEQKRKAGEKEIDRILIKVKNKGLNSLTEAEKRALQQETHHKNRP